MAKKRTIVGSAIVPFRFVFFIWFLFAVEFLYGLPLSDYGVFPRTWVGLIGIFSAPLLHANFSHIISNTVPLLMLGAVLFYFYPTLAVRVFYRSYFLTNILVWLFARPAIHIGASGLIYGLASFLIFYGLVRRSLYSLIISLVIILFYGSLIYGILPTQSWISWESHLAGFLVGIYASFELKKAKI